MAFTIMPSDQIIKQKIETVYRNGEKISSYSKIDYNKKGQVIKSSWFNADHSLKSYHEVEYFNDKNEQILRRYTNSGELKETRFSRNNAYGDEVFSKRTYHLRKPVGEYIDQHKYYYNADSNVVKIERFSGPTTDTIDWVYNYKYNKKGLKVFSDSKFKEEKRDETEYFYKRGVLKKSITYDYMEEGKRLAHSYKKFTYNKAGNLVKKEVESCYKWSEPRDFKLYLSEYTYDQEGNVLTDKWIEEKGDVRLKKTSYIYY